MRTPSYGRNPSFYQKNVKIEDSIQGTAQEQRNLTLSVHELWIIHILVFAGSLSSFTEITEHKFISLQ